jgi:hypothetical protein
LESTDRTACGKPPSAALIAAVAVVAAELAPIALIRHRYNELPTMAAALVVGLA